MPSLRDADAVERAGRIEGRDYSEALSRGLRIIQAFDADARMLTLSDIARAVDLPRATVRRSLITLVHMGFVTAEGRAFALTPKVLSLAAAYLASSASSAIFQPACEQLASAHGEIFSIAVLDAPHAVMIAYARPRSQYSFGDGIGLRIPAHCTAVGRVLLAAMSEPARTAFLDRHGHAAITRRTMTDRERLRAEIAGVARQGWAMVEDEAELGFRSLAVPVRDRAGRVRFALNAGMATLSCSGGEARDRLVPVLTNEAERLREVLI